MVARTGTNIGMPKRTVCSASSSIISFDKNPLSSGIPAIDSAANVATTKVTGISVRKPPRRRISRV